MGAGDIILIKMLFNYASIIYFYKAIDTVKTFIEINIGFKFSTEWFPIVIFLDTNALCQVLCPEVHKAASKVLCVE